MGENIEETTRFSDEEKQSMDISRTERDLSLLKDGAKRLPDGRVEITGKQNSEIYEKEVEIRVDLTDKEMLIIGELLQKEVMVLSERQDGVAKREILMVKPILDKIKFLSSKHYRQFTDRDRNIGK